MHSGPSHQATAQSVYYPPAVAVPRLSLSSAGKVVYTLKTPYRDGTTQVPFEGAAIRIDIEVCDRCGGSVRVIVGAPNRCIEDQDITEVILAHLRDKEQNTPNLPHLAPSTRAPPETR